MFEKAVKNCMLAKVSLDDIADAEERMGIKFPESLLKFYREYGYGFVNNKRHAINKLLAPGNCADIRLREDAYEEDSFLETIWEDNGMEEWSLIFFETYPGMYIAIGLDDGKIYSPSFGLEEEPIADSLEEFLEEIVEPEYWVDPDCREYTFDDIDDDEDYYDEDEDDYDDEDEDDYDEEDDEDEDGDN